MKAVEEGRSFVITRRGKPVAKLVPVEEGQRVLTPEQEAASARALELRRRGIDLAGARFDRDELYER